MPFDRLIAAMDDWAAANPVDVLAQTGASSYVPRALRCKQSLTPDEYAEAVRNCSLMVAHAGMGSVLTALEAGRPLLVLPRRGALRETRDDHQVATANWLRHRENVFVAMDEKELAIVLREALHAAGSRRRITSHAAPPLLDALKDFIDDGPGQRLGRFSNQAS